MASIPVSQIQAPAPDRGTGGFKVDYGALVAAQKAPTINVSAMAAEAGAMQAYGAAATALSEPMMKVAEAQWASINRRKVDDATAQLAAASDDISSRIGEEQDETKWADIFLSEASRYGDEILKDKSLAPAAREAIESKISSWRITGESAVRRRSFDRTLQKEAQGLERDRILAVERGDFDAALQITEQKRSRGLASEDQAAKEAVVTRSAQEVKLKEAQWDQEYQAITGDPDAYLKDNSKKRDGESPEEHARRINAAQAVARDAFKARTDRLADMLADPALDPNALNEEMKDLPPRVQQHYRDAYLEMQNSARRQERMKPENINVAWAKLDEAVQEFDPEAKNAREEYVRIRTMTVQELPEGYRQDVLDALDGKWRGTGLEADISTKTEILDAIDAAYSEGQFGTVTVTQKQGFDTASGLWEPVKAGKTYSKIRDEAVDAPEEAKRMARIIKTGVKRRMLEILGRNPEMDATEAFQQLDAIKHGKRLEAAPGLRFGGDAAPEVERPVLRSKTTRRQVDEVPELPQGSGPPENSLLPSLDYKPERNSP